MALAMMVQTCLWLAGAVSAHRDLPLLRQRIERVRRCAAHRPLWAVPMAASPPSERFGRRFVIRSVREPRRPRLRPWRNVGIAQVVKRSAQRWVVEVERRIVEGTPARVETPRRRSHRDGVINTRSPERLKATRRERLAALTRRGRALARHTVTLRCL